MRETLILPVGDKVSEVSFSEELPVPEEGADRLHIFDENTAALFPRLPAASVVLEPGEAAKTWKSVEGILREAVARGMARDSVFVGVGGGVVCDIAAFAASVFMRGTGLELVPTSLLAMVDAAFGGKTAVDFAGYKNLVGTFHPAERIRVSAAFLATLPEREFLSGLAEVVKSAMLGDPGLLDFVSERGSELLSPRSRSRAGDMLEPARRSLLVKARFVAADPEERGVRAHLNLGHTFAHGLETATSFARFSHGEAVAWGILRALDAGLRLGITEPGWADRIGKLISSFPFPVTVPGVRVEDVLAAMRLDKKKKNGRVRFVLQRKAADTLTMPLDDDLVEEIVRRGLAAD